MGHYLVPWHFPVYIEPWASLLLSITTYRNTFFPFFLLTAFLLIDYDWRPTDRPTDRQTDSIVTFLSESGRTLPQYYSTPWGSCGSILAL